MTIKDKVWNSIKNIEIGKKDLNIIDININGNKAIIYYSLNLGDLGIIYNTAEVEYEEK